MRLTEVSFVSTTIPLQALAQGACDTVHGVSRADRDASKLGGSPAFLAARNAPPMSRGTAPSALDPSVPTIGVTTPVINPATTLDAMAIWGTIGISTPRVIRPPDRTSPEFNAIWGTTASVGQAPF